jgi:hypothetical protein
MSVSLRDNQTVQHRDRGSVRLHWSCDTKVTTLSRLGTSSTDVSIERLERRVCL